MNKVQNTGNEKAFLALVDLSDSPEIPREIWFLAALVGAAEFKQRADRAGCMVLEYARRIKVRRDMDDV